MVDYEIAPGAAKASRALAGVFAPGRVRFGLRAKIALAMIAISVVSLASLTFYMYRGVDLLTERDLTRLSRSVGITASRLAAEMDNYRKDTLFLSKTPPIMGIHRAHDAGGVDPADGSTDVLWRDRLATIFTGLLEARPEYIQARYIGVDNGGRELVRVDRRTSGAIETTPPELLQAKADRPYFMDAALLNAGVVYFSDIDLNRDFGAIEVPHRPVVRTATPIRDVNGKLLGIVVINIDFQFLLDRTAGEIPDRYSLYVANSHGDFLDHPIAARAFGFDLGHRYLLQEELPQMAGVVAERVDGFAGLIDVEGDRHLAVAEAVSYDPSDREHDIILATVAREAGLSAEARALQRGALLAGTVMLALSMVAIVWLVDLIVRPLTGMTRMAMGIAAGDRAIDVSGYAGRRDEIGNLANSFAAMTGEVARREGELIEQKNALYQSEALFRETVEFAPDGLLIVDEDGMIVLANSAVQSIFGYRQSELIGKPVEVLVPDAARQKHRASRAAYAKAPTRRNMLSGLDIVGQTKDGASIPVEVSLGPANLQGDRVTLAIIRDVSERRQLERTLSGYAAELERSNAELSQFAYIASHDLQEPLRMVDSYVNLLARRYKGKLDEEADEFIGFATDGARRMKQLINELLDYSRVSNRPLKLASVDTGAMVTRVTDLLHDRIVEADAVITVADLPTVSADPGQLERLFVNLVSNAIKYRGEDAPKIDITVELKDGMYEFSVRDNGIGIAPEFRQKVFEIFTRLHSRAEYDGTGIGLASCKRIVERHGGEIWAEGSETVGSVFRFTLPAQTKEA